VKHNIYILLHAFSATVRLLHSWAGPRPRRFSPSGIFGFFLCGLVLLTSPHSPLECKSFLPLVTAVLITFKGAEPPDSHLIGVIGALGVFFHPRPSRTNFLLLSWPGSALRHWEVADCPEVADSKDARACPQKTPDMDGLRYSPDDLHYGLEPVHTSLYVRVTWDWWLGHLPRSPERARVETGGADLWVLKRRELPGFARVNKVTSASLGYPLLVFNKNCTLKALFPFHGKQQGKGKKGHKDSCVRLRQDCVLHISYRNRSDSDVSFSSSWIQLPVL